MKSNSKYRKVNRSLDLEPLIFFIPSDMFLPWSGMILVALVAKGTLELDWYVTAGLAGWGIATWWLLTYKGAWRFLAKFVSVPYWIRGVGKYVSVLLKSKKNI